MNTGEHFGWDYLRHGGLLLDPARIRQLVEYVPEPLSEYQARELRRRVAMLLDGATAPADFAAHVLEAVCGFASDDVRWMRGPQVPPAWGRRAITGEVIKPRLLWEGIRGGKLPVFIDRERRVGIGRGKRAVSNTLQWLRLGDEQLALLTNGYQWRLIFAGLDFDAWCEWDIDLWFQEGEPSSQIAALRTLFNPDLWTPPETDGTPPLLQAILDSRKGQAELSAVLGERIREAVEILVQAHGEILKARCGDVNPAEIYRAAVRVVMRMVVVMFAESRELLPRDNTIYHGVYGLNGLMEALEKVAARSRARLNRSWNAWPRVLGLFRLVYYGSHHPDLAATKYGGELFAPGNPVSKSGLDRALAVFETACFEAEVLPDHQVYRMLKRITRTRIRIRQGRSGTWVPAPVDFSDLSSEYIGILYEGLLDFELKTADEGDPVIFLAVGKQPALPLSRLEQMEDKAIANLFDRLKDTSRADEEETAEEEIEDETETAETPESEEQEDEDTDTRHTTRTRAETWARRAVESAGLVRKPRGTITAERRLAHEKDVGRKAHQLVSRVVLPGEWYVVRWGGTRKGSGTFYTRPGLAVPTVQRTLRPLAYDPPIGDDGEPDLLAPAAAWIPKTPDEILSLKVCDPACGSGTFPVAALRFLTGALYASLHQHGRIREYAGQSIVQLLRPEETGPDVLPEERLGEEKLPCRPDDENFERMLKAILRRYVVERCIYGVDIDPLAVELCRLSLWIETMDRELPFSFLDHKIKVGNSLVGAWFDQFRHYPAMAWKNRDGGDKNHTNGVHFEKEARTKAIKAFVTDRLVPDLQRYLAGRTLFDEDLQEQAMAVHDEALQVLSRLNETPVHDPAEQARIYREELVGSGAYQYLRAAMDQWCACWFWPPGELDHAPLPSHFASPSSETREITARLAREKGFFHWELEFPDVFDAPGAGFDAILGNPPWENLQPNPEEFFSNIDPLFRTYGRLAKNEALKQLFGADRKLEKSWLDYSADFNAVSNWVTNVANPCGDVKSEVGDSFSIQRGKQNKTLHELWRSARRRSKGYTRGEHPFQYQMGRLFTYKLFLEHSYALLRTGGRLGQIVPSGLYSDAWSQPLRELFLYGCRWEWLFGFENREKIFDIHRSFKFNPVIIEKGGATEAIRTAFMRRKLEDWERAEAIATPFTREQVEQFSPKSKAILEIQSARDIEILEKIYANSVLLGDDGPEGWGIKYRLEFMMNTDAKLFPPRPKWEVKGYRPDEYSRWLRGKWRPIEALWAELGIDPAKVTPTDPSCEAELRARAHEVQHTDWQGRCAQPPYDTLPIPRADIPEGIILSREADGWIPEEQIEDVALPLYVGKMINLWNWLSNSSGQAGVPRIEPDYLLRESDLRHEALLGMRLVIRDIARTTDQRTVITTVVPSFPCGNVLPILEFQTAAPSAKLGLLSIMSGFPFDWATRVRLTGTHLNWHVAESLAVPPMEDVPTQMVRAAAGLCADNRLFAADRIRLHAAGLTIRHQAIQQKERLRIISMLHAAAAAIMGLSLNDYCHLMTEVDLPNPAKHTIGGKGFWRIDKDIPPEHRQTVLSLVAMHNLEQKIRDHGGDRDAGIRAFLEQNDGEGWMLPETLRLADYGLGHDERALEHQPVASRLGPRFYDWQLAQTPEESWRECHLHARNMLGKSGYEELLREIAGHTDGKPEVGDAKEASMVREEGGQYGLFR